LLRLILIIVAVLIIFRLLTSIFRDARKKPLRGTKKRKLKDPVGKGWIVDDKEKKENKN
jgi:TRAP-type C4-dicarboxylate transport system permease small subunit